MKETAKFMASKLGDSKNFDGRKDLVILAGDFNQNGGALNANQ